MTHEQFTFWLRGYLAAQSDSQMKIDIERALDSIQEHPKTHTDFKRLERTKTPTPEIFRSDETSGFPYTGGPSTTVIKYATTDTYKIPENKTLLND